jgi:hypothetical protein
MPAAQSTRTRSPCYGRPIASGQALARWVSTTPTRSAFRHYVGPRELAVIRPLALPSYVPSLQGRYPLLSYYERSDPGQPIGAPVPDPARCLEEDLDCAGSVAATALSPAQDGRE